MQKLVALKINDVTYPIYQACGEPNQYALSEINDQFLVKDAAQPDAWMWFTERDFRENFKFILDPPLPTTKFSAVERLPSE